MVEENEKTIKTFTPGSFLRRCFYFLRKRVALIITNQKIVYRGNFSDKEIKIQEISDVFITNDQNLDILKKGNPPTDESLLGELISNDTLMPIYKGYISVNWLSKSQRKEASEIIKNLIK